MPTPSYYAAQVRGGSERRQRDKLLASAPDVVLDCFVPEYETKRARNGAWHIERALLFPGYLFIQTNDPVALAEVLARSVGFMKLLGGNGERFVPLTKEEVAWLDVFTDAGTHVVGMSEGCIEGDRVTVTKGPLKGQEAQIAKIDRHRRMAVLEVQMFNQVKQVQVGLEIVWKKA